MPARRIREAMALYRQSEDLIQLGAYVSGTNPKLDASIRSRDQMLQFLRQDAAAKSTRERRLRQLRRSPPCCHEEFSVFAWTGCSTGAARRSSWKKPS